MNLLQRILTITKMNDESTDESNTGYAQFYLLECWNQYADLPDVLLPHVDKVRKKEDWEKDGFVLSLNKYGQVRKFKVENKYFSFIPVEAQHPAEIDAIRNGKRLTANPEHIALLVKKGCSPEEFYYKPH